MSKEAMFTLKLERDLRDQFMTEAAAADRPASQLVREFMRDFVRQAHEAREHDHWFRAEVEQGLQEADNPNLNRTPHDEIASDWQRYRAELATRIGEPTE